MNTQSQQIQDVTAEVRHERRSYGRFTEDLVKALSSGIEINGRALLVDEVELGDDPTYEKVEVRFRLQSADATDQSEPVFAYPFTSEIPVEQNLEELRSFLEAFGDVAGQRLSVEQSSSANSIAQY